MNTVPIILLLTILSVSAHGDHKKIVHQCMHDDMDASKLVPKEYLETFEETYGDRSLQASNPQPIRITVDFKELDNPANGDGLTPSKKQYLKNIIQAAQTYLNKLIKVNPRTKPVKMTWGETCYDIKVTKEIQDVGIDNSDLHIYVTYSNEPNTTYLANAIWCQLDPNPIVGRVKFNIGVMDIDENSTQSFQDNFSTSLHEILHILGFSGNGVNYWIDPETGKPYGDQSSKVIVREKRWDKDNVNKVLSKNIVRVSRNHYACPSIDGMFLENQGGGGSMGSHWERDLLGNEFMTASIVYGTYTISEFTAALLLDTGYYAEINSNLLMPIFWGKNKGCDFFNKSCNAGVSFPEFPDASIKESCDFFSLGMGSNGNYDYFSQCSRISAYGNAYCEDSDTFKPDERNRQNTGAGSRCFRSNAAKNGEDNQEMKGRCFKAKCGEDLQSIEVNVWGNEFVSCKYPNQVINLSTETKTSQGIMKCPDDFDLFCNFPRSCPNNCSNNGICNNGYCVCLNGWAGEDCAKPCPSNQAWDGSRCVSRCPSSQFKNLDNTCKSTCPYKQYKDQTTGNCELCSVNCSVCTGPSSNQCIACNNGYTLNGSKCVDLSCDESCSSCNGRGPNQCTSCPAGKYLDSNKSCQACISPCQNCVTATSCSTCATGFFMDNASGQCISNNTCDSSCKTCSEFRNPNKCTSCKDGQFVNRDGKCTKCNQSCKSCTVESDQCIECSNGYQYEPRNQRCYMKCHSSCRGCTNPLDSKSCTACFQAFYLNQNQCLPCDSSCATCSEPKYCTSCKDGFNFDSRYGSCAPICKNGEYLERGITCKPCESPCATCEIYGNRCLTCISGFTLNSQYNVCEAQNQQCHQSCRTCTRYNDPRGCDSCNDGQYLSSGSCLVCAKGCASCNTTAQNCTRCQDGFVLENGRCNKKQNITCHASCRTCSASPSGNRMNCTSCFDGLYLQGYTCLPCQSSCKTCTDQSSKCLSCDTNLYTFNSHNYTCELKGCHSTCKTCSKPNDSQSCSSCSDGYFMKGNSCYACSSTCKTCSDTNVCTSCFDSFDLKNGTCQQKQVNGKCHQSCTTCFKDNDPLACLTCPDNQWLQTNSNKTLARCLPCDSACKSCKSTYECTACAGETVFDEYNYCRPCQSDKKFENGKCVTPNSTSVKKQVTNQNCDHSCSSCVGPLYDSCTACAANRVLQKKRSDLNYGYCVCPPKTTDVNQPMCEVASSLQDNIKSGTSSAFVASATTSSIVSATTSNPVVAISMMEFSQSVSYLSYVNKKTAVGFDDTMNVVSYSHTSNLINLDHYAEQDAENERINMKNRNLAESTPTTIDVDEDDEVENRNPKFSYNHKTQLFLINALVLIVINCFVWAIAGILALFKVNQEKESLFFKLRRIYNISIPIVVFTLSSQEFSLLMFLQMFNLKANTGLQILSSVFSFLTLFYILGFTCFLFYWIEFKKVLCTDSQANEVWQQRFYLINKYIKQDNFFTRNFVQITVLRKVIISFITATIVSYPIAQISLLLICYTTYLIYLTICKPFKSALYTSMMIILDAIIITMHILYCIMFAYEGDSEKEKVISLMMLFLTFTVFAAYLIYTLIIIAKISYNLYKKWQAKKLNKKSYVKRPQVEEENPVAQIDQQIANLSQKTGSYAS